MFFKLTSVLLCVMLLLSSCGVLDKIIEPSEGSKNNKSIHEPLQISEISYSSDDFTTVLSEFSNTLYNAVSDSNSTKENIIFSPLSVMYALALTSNGAEDQTLAEFENLFGGITVNEMNKRLSQLTNGLESSKESKVIIGNSIWANSNFFALSNDYLNTAKKYYSAEARSLMFDSKAVKEINDWVKDKTDGLIEKAVENLDPTLATVLINTVLFDGMWDKEYNENDISSGKFHNNDRSTSDVEYLYSQESSKYFEVSGGIGFSKAYKDGYSFTAVLPHNSVEELLASTSISEIIAASRLSLEDVKVYIPKFEYEYSKSLNTALQGMGLTTAFTESADFDKMSENRTANIMISEIFQKAKIVLNEHGTKAAAVTTITYATCAMSVQEVKTIRLDRPFLFIIQDSNGNPLFIGSVYSLN